MAKSKAENNGLKTGLGVAAAAAVAAGLYYFFGTEKGKRSRKELKGWAVKARGEIMERLEQAEEVSQESYKNIINSVLAKYKNIKNIKKEDLSKLAGDLYGHWNEISKEIKQLGAPKKRASRGKK